jgi:hypothetical protein
LIFLITNDEDFAVFAPKNRIFRVMEYKKANYFMATTFVGRQNKPFYDG